MRLLDNIYSTKHFTAFPGEGKCTLADACRHPVRVRNRVSELFNVYAVTVKGKVRVERMWGNLLHPL